MQYLHKSLGKELRAFIEILQKKTLKQNYNWGYVKNVYKLQCLMC